ncbi:hypothetical protein ACQP1U_08790 [Actinomycetota bacterium]
MLAGASRMRWVLLERDCGGSASVRCYVGRHSDRTIRPNVEDPGVLAKECRRCGRVMDPRQYGHRGAEGTAYGNIYISQGM